MHVSMLKLTLKLKLRAFLRRVRHRRKPCPTSLLSLPNELLQEIAYFLSKREQKALRFVCHRANIVLRTTVLSVILVNLTLPLRCSDQDVLEYLNSHGPAGYVHELRVCIWGSHSEQHAPTHWGVAEGGSVEDKPRSTSQRLQIKADTNAFRALYNAAFVSLINLRAFALCISNGSRKAPPFLFQDTFKWLMKRPTLDLHLTHPEFTLPYFSYLSQFRNIRRFSLTGYSNNSTPTIEKTLAHVLANNHHLSHLFLHLADRWDRSTTSLVVSGIERVFPKQTTRTVSLRRLSLKEGSIIVAPHIFYHLRGLKLLKISNIDLYHASAEFWTELSQQEIYIASIMLRSRSVPSTVIEYLVFNKGMTELTFEVETDRGSIAKRVLSEVVPRHSRTLEVLQLTSCWGSHWTFGCLPEYVVGASQCVNLRVLGIVVEGNKDFTGLVLSLLKFLPKLQALRLVAHTNDFAPVVKRIERIRDHQALLKRLQVIVSVSYRGHIKFAAGQSGWDFDDKEPDVLRDDTWYLGA
ncbi:hypothetical protein DFS33DRAFT_214776 [Desarmillaria ectypa]|nr:hypothetical protein DFS33DRAFT_214776 [Desarmillaria ectypa]